jgi:hypothetical protein
MGKIKDLIQHIFMQKKLCAGCTTSLDQSIKRENIDSEIELVTCRCGRYYIYEKTTETYKKIDAEQYNKYQQFLQRRRQRDSH